jgi:hypothetical protein
VLACVVMLRGGCAGGAEPEGLITLQKTRELAAQLRTKQLPTFQPYR